ncbi:hypothetical protein CBS63078_1350 [Aspergillus niger]|uniref:Uncharacterized protein n=2 Tax=Aspergillus TaxID=5052 RepID=A0A254UBC0_ASPNG|nr:hypothetical protein CBS12448_5079 [Aspergillus niger]RDK40252.1 hypothetical protein M752DRAFT_277597 [Aspergillus phoenicis ATCC 13157]KAI2892118.1 hypothetical protein CBS13152_4930 [Aspergillus niger]KAI2919340.1 hypothetical protein CBS147371_3703 [Aspergillus niger]KAI2927509.1 hypothetical protein CBS147320_5099 [Aspergillus niger]
MSPLSQMSRPLVRSSSNMRSFSIAVPARREGQVINPKPRGYLADKEPITRREATSERYFVRTQPTQPEQPETYQMVRQKMLEHRRHLDELDQYLQILGRKQGPTSYY